MDFRDRLSQAAASQGLATGWGMPLGFTQPNAAPPGEAYEHFIARTGQVPTRSNRHDQLNAAMWLRFPQAKAALNKAQANAMALAQGLGAGPRGHVRDWATHWDEMGMVIACSSDSVAQHLLGLWRAHDWLGLLWHEDTRRLWGCDVHAVPFGHALMERWLAPAQPHKGLTAKCWVMVAAMPKGYVDFESLDQCLASALRGSLPRLLPLPVMGLPGACQENTARAFYEDEAVFRPASC